MSTRCHPPCASDDTVATPPLGFPALEDTTFTHPTVRQRPLRSRPRQRLPAAVPLRCPQHCPRLHQLRMRYPRRTWDAQKEPRLALALVDYSSCYAASACVCVIAVAAVSVADEPNLQRKKRPRPTNLRRGPTLHGMIRTCPESCHQKQGHRSFSRASL